MPVSSTVPPSPPPATSGMVVDNICKSFTNPRGGGTVAALSQVSFTAPMGKALGILGSNGAGKTTLINILTTVIRPDNGTAWINGHNVHNNPNPIREQLGVVSQDDRFDNYLTLWENLSLHAELHGLKKRHFTPHINHLLKQVDLYDRRHSYLDTFSGGMKRKASLIRALIHKPTILFLDEPTTGLDPLARRQVWDAIRTLKEGRTLILTTHYMQEADELSDHIVLMDKGKLIQQGTPTELKRQVAEQRCGWHYQLQLKQPVANTLLPTVQTALANTPGVTLTATNAETIQLDFSRQPDSLEFIPAIIQHLSPQVFHSIHQQLPDLETVFFSAIGHTPEALIASSTPTPEPPAHE